MNENVQEWFANFVDTMGQYPLFELIIATNYLDIKPLLDLTCAKVASTLKNKTTKEVCEMFNIEQDLTEEEEANIRQENRWCEETAQEDNDGK